MLDEEKRTLRQIIEQYDQSEGEKKTEKKEEPADSEEKEQAPAKETQEKIEEQDQEKGEQEEKEESAPIEEEKEKEEEEEKEELTSAETSEEPVKKPTAPRPSPFVAEQKEAQPIRLERRTGPIWGEKKEEPAQREEPIKRERPGRSEERKVDERFLLPPRYKPVQEPQEWPGKLSLAISAFALLMSLLILVYVFFYTQPSAGVPASELKAIAGDLKEIKDSSVEVGDSFVSSSSVNAEIPVSDAMDEVVQVPVRMDIPVTGTITGTAPWGSTVTIPVNGTIPINFVANMTIGKSSQNIRVNVQVPANTTTKFTIKPSDYWQKQLDDIINRLEKMAS